MPSSNSNSSILGRFDNCGFSTWTSANPFDRNIHVFLNKFNISAAIFWKFFIFCDLANISFPTSKSLIINFYITQNI